MPMKKILTFLALFVLLFVLIDSVAAEKCYVNATKIVKVEIEVPYNVTKYETVRIGEGSPHCERTMWNYSTSKSVSFQNINQTPYFVCSITISNRANESAEWTFYAKYNDASKTITDKVVLEVMGEESKTHSFFYKNPLLNTNCEIIMEKTPIKEVCFYSFYKEVKKPVIVTLYKNITVDQKVVEQIEVDCDSILAKPNIFQRIWLFFKYLFS